jgi:hypothetical protein
MSQGWTFPEAEYSGWVKWRTGDLSQPAGPRYVPYLYPAGGPEGRRLRVAGGAVVGPRSCAVADRLGALSWLAIAGASGGQPWGQDPANRRDQVVFGCGAGRAKTRVAAGKMPTCANGRKRLDITANPRPPVRIRAAPLRAGQRLTRTVAPAMEYGARQQTLRWATSIGGFLVFLPASRRSPARAGSRSALAGGWAGSGYASRRAVMIPRYGSSFVATAGADRGAPAPRPSPRSARRGSKLDDSRACPLSSNCHEICGHCGAPRPRPDFGASSSRSPAPPTPPTSTRCGVSPIGRAPALPSSFPVSIR